MAVTLPEPWELEMRYQANLEKGKVFRICAECEEPIYYDEYYVDMDGDYYHEDCALEYCRRWIRENARMEEES